MPGREGLVGEPTQHVAKLILTSSLVSNRRGNAHIGEGEVLDTIVSEIQSPYNGEPKAVVYIKTDLHEPRAKRGQIEHINIDMGSIEPKFCGRKPINTEFGPESVGKPLGKRGRVGEGEQSLYQSVLALHL